MGLLRRLFGPPPTPPPRLRDVIERLDGLEADVAGLRKRLIKIQGLVTGGMRREEEAQDATGDTNGDRAVSQGPPNRWRRLRGF